MTDLIIHSGQILDPATGPEPFAADLWVSGGHIAQISRRDETIPHAVPDTAESAVRAVDGDIRSIDATGKLILPGFVNAHYHSSDTLLKGRFESTFLEHWMLRALPMLYGARSADEIYLRTLVGAIDALSYGITTVQDMVGFVPSTPQAIAAAVAAYRDAGIRVVLAPQCADRTPLDSIPDWRTTIPADLHTLLRPPPQQADETVMGLHELLEYIADQRSSSSPDCLLTWGVALSGPERATAGLIRALGAWSRDHSAPLFSHAAISRAERVQARREFGGSAIEYLDRLGALGPQTTLAHCVWIDDADCSRIADRGASIVHNPVSNLKTRNGIAPVQRWYEHGIRVAVGCDNSSCGDSQNIFTAMKMHVLLAGLADTGIDRPRAIDALRAATVRGAAAVGLGGTVGRIAPGFAADMVLLDLSDTAYLPLNDPARQLVFAESGRGVDTVIVGGEIVSVRGRSTRFPPDAVAGLLRDTLPGVQRDAASVARRVDRLEPSLRQAERGYWNA